ncbi:MAG: SDR family oxidoreductase [Enterococcus sp.]
MKVLVTGASGNVGQYVVKELIKQDVPVVAAGSDPSKLSQIFATNVETVKFDFTDETTFATALNEVDRVFLMRPPHLGKPEDLYPFIDAMKEHGIQLVSFLSLMGIEKNPMPPHYKIEKKIEQVGLPYSHIRPGFFMQNLTGVHAAEIIQNNEIFVPAGKSQTSFIDAQDIGLAVATVLATPTQYQNTTHTITGPESLDYYQVAEALSQVLARKITYAKPSFIKYRQYYIHQRKLAKDYVNVTVALYFMTCLGTAKQVTNDFFQLTGQQPQTIRNFFERNQMEFVARKERS